MCLLIYFRACAYFVRRLFVCMSVRLFAEAMGPGFLVATRALARLGPQSSHLLFDSGGVCSNILVFRVCPRSTPFFFDKSVGIAVKVIMLTLKWCLLVPAVWQAGALALASVPADGAHGSCGESFGRSLPPDVPQGYICKYSTDQNYITKTKSETVSYANILTFAENVYKHI